ncbi:membrane signaling protein [Scheffersomyces amazonensis]|uniref:membrane signaling protein n=1 Tax=Scheffersomyces amazonensis TaxID=1078765 RepID=UPI00315C806D
MKFGESLSEGLVPEWKEQYVDYKSGKKLIKKIVQLKQESEAEASAKASNDRMPLLNSQDGVGPSMPYTNEINEITELSNELNKPRMSRRTSIFNYSIRSKDVDKKDEFEKERVKFTQWLDSELNKVDQFYREKEQEAYERFLLIQDQLYQLRDHKASVVREKTKHSGAIHGDDAIKIYANVNDLAFHTKSAFSWLNRLELPSLPSTTFLTKLKRRPRDNDITMTDQMQEYNPNDAENRIRNGEIDFTSDETDLSSIDSEDSRQVGDVPNLVQYPNQDQARQTRRRDYSVKKQHFGVPYLYARKQLKEVVLEHYRALSLLRSYKALNRTAFRKITKKFDKALKGNLLDTYMSKIDKSYFQTTDLVDKLSNHVEELFIAFFDPETTDRKHSLEKLKSIAYAMNNNDIRQPSYYKSFFSSGFLMGFSVPLLTLAIYLALNKTLSGTLPEGVYLLQIWGGFFLLNVMLILFGINLAVFDHYKINYKFIFEFDMSSVLNYKQYWLLPSFGIALLALVSWFSFHDFWPNQFAGRDWPWIYFGLMLAIFLWPGDQFYGSSRKWLQIAIWRLLLSGFYPVEFRDFFLGDIFCSLTYTMGNLSFFFCLYAHHWNGIIGDTGKENMCGSSKSRLMGFFSTLPSIWRFLQCVRRYMDTGDWFPHLANMLKYAISTLYYCLLSVYRIDRIQRNRATFITFAAINSIYSSLWDVFMDWSLLQSGSKYPYLRDNLFYKNPNFYYFAMVTDVILRFQWIFYAFFSNQIQQSAVTSFCIALAEIIRRFIWIFFRMENEHCTNVVLFRASKDSPLPYIVSPKVEKAIKKLANARYTAFVGENENVLERLGTSQRLPSADRISSYSTSRQDVSDRFRPGEHESDLGLARVSSATSSLPQLSRRKSTFVNISDTLNKAHIKDFQRRKTRINLDDDSDDDDDDAVSTRRFPSKNTTGSQLPSVNENEEL